MTAAPPLRLVLVPVETLDGLWELAHQAWHALDDSEERDDEIAIPKHAMESLYKAFDTVTGEEDGDIHLVLPPLSSAPEAPSEEMVEALRWRIAAGHNDSCMTRLDLDEPQDCSCGHDGIVAALAALLAGPKG